MYIDALGLPSAKIKQLEENGFETIEDVAGYFPKKYYDFRKPIQIAALRHKEIQACVATLKRKEKRGKVVVFSLRDVSGEWLNVSWFNASFLMGIFEVGEEVFVAGKVTVDGYGKSITNPMVFSKEIAKSCRIHPVYKKIQGMSIDYLEKSISAAIQLMPTSDYLEPQIIYDYGLISQKKAYQLLHSPQTMNDVKMAEMRITFDKMFNYALKMNMLNSVRYEKSHYKLTTFKYSKQIIEKLPFTLTDGQAEVLRELSVKMFNGIKIDALIQGDVGCGKTLVAILMMASMVEAGHQAVLMAPTNVLAKQHYLEIRERMKDLDVEIAFLSSETKKREKTKIMKGVADGSIQIVVGTHSVISDDLEYKSLGLMVVDEEHRFGVKQRDAIKMRSMRGLNQLNMSATPIPRSLTLALYGDSMESYTIKSLPNGRKQVKTGLLQDEQRAWNGIRQEVLKGHQAYVVCPLIEESDSAAMSNVESVDEVYEKLVKEFQGSDINVAKITGKMKPNEVEEIIEAFSRNEIQVVVSTTIIEVGVNVPNATIIVIKNAERFGLAQLHQLRGRVGRSSLQSYCVLVSEKKDNEKLIAMKQSTDGFFIAKRDLEIRGSGDWIGTKQSGSNPYVDIILANMGVYEKIQKLTKEIVRNPIRLSKYESLNILVENGVVLVK